MKKETLTKKLDTLLRIKCTGCGGCCTNSVVPVTDSDLKRLIKHTGMVPKDIIRFVDEDDIDFDADAPNWVELKKGKRALALKKKKDRCMFLDDEARCTVYTARPATCRSFPIAIDLDENDKIDSLSLNRMIKNKYPSGKKKPLKDLMVVALMEDREDQKFYHKIEKWNKKHAKGSKSDFLKFLKVQ